MEIKIKYNGDLVSVPIDPKTTVAKVVKHLAKEFNITPGAIKLIHKGKQITKSNNKIMDEGVKSGDKLLLNYTEKPGKKGGQKRAQKNERRKKTTEIIPDDIQLPEIAKKGPPPGAIEGLNSQVSKLPKTPFVVYTNEGKIAYLSVESDALFIKCEDGTCERLFDVSYNTKSCSVPGFEGYISLYLKTQNNELRVYHYIPKQYQNVLKEYLTSLERC